MMYNPQLFKPVFIKDFQSLSESLACAINADVVSVKQYELQDHNFAMFVLDKFFHRSASSTSLSVFAVSTPEGTALELVPSGGAASYFFSCDFGTESDFSSQAEKVLKDWGWTELDGTNRLKNNQK